MMGRANASKCCERRILCPSGDNRNEMNLLASAACGAARPDDTANRIGAPRTVSVSPGVTQEEAVAAAKADPAIAKFLTGAPKKIILVPGRLLNIVV